MVKKAKATLGRILNSTSSLSTRANGLQIRAIIIRCNNLDGLNIHCAIVDELHAHKTRDVWDVLETATGARLQSLLFGITTAGFNKEGICYELRDYAIKVLRGRLKTIRFAIIYTLDEGDDPLMKKSGRRRIRGWVSVSAGMTCAAR